MREHLQNADNVMIDTMKRYRHRHCHRSRGLLLIASVALSEVAVAFVAPMLSKVGFSAVAAGARPRESLSSFEGAFVERQRTVSGDADGDARDSATATERTRWSVRDHLDHQRACFDDMSGFFASDEATPPEIVPVLKYLAHRSLGSAITRAGLGEDGGRVLDVGCGAGALFPAYLEAANDLGVDLDITGLDLSPRMVDCANENARRLLLEGDNARHSVNCVVGDFVRTTLGVDSAALSLIGFDQGIVDEDTDEYRGKFDVVVINACFGNFYDADSVVTAAASCLKEDGVFVIAHPLGAEFVDKLRRESPKTVPGSLPSREDLAPMLAHQPLELLELAHEAEINGETRSLYYASMRRTPYRALREVVRMRGPVAEGYGRGGKKLGFPTANLPSSLFADALADVPMGVYFGLASIEPSSEGESAKGRGTTHRAVVNVGYSPTFDGEENREKIVEAHLIVGEGEIEGDFYGETMRLALCGFLRPEMKFPSFPDLIKAITNDVQTAKLSLDLEPYGKLIDDPFLTVLGRKWIGRTGGNTSASYEFENFAELSTRKSGKF